MAVYNSLLQTCSSLIDQVRLKALATPHVGDWLLAPPLTSIGLRLSDEAIRVATSYRLGTTICQPHTCVCGTMVDARGLHGLACRKSAPRHVRHSQLNDVKWRAVKKTQTSANKEPVGLSRADGKRPDGATLVPMPRRTYHLRRSQFVQPPRSLLRTSRQSTPPSRQPTCSFPPLWRQAAPDAPSQRHSLMISAIPSSPASRWKERISFR